jgi:hypothetical protein
MNCKIYFLSIALLFLAIKSHAEKTLEALLRSVTFFELVSSHKIVPLSGMNGPWEFSMKQRDPYIYFEQADTNWNKRGMEISILGHTRFNPEKKIKGIDHEAPNFKIDVNMDIDPKGITDIVGFRLDIDSQALLPKREKLTTEDKKREKEGVIYFLSAFLNYKNLNFDSFPVECDHKPDCCKYYSKRHNIKLVAKTSFLEFINSNIYQDSDEED